MTEKNTKSLSGDARPLPAKKERTIRVALNVKVKLETLDLIDEIAVPGGPTIQDVVDNAIEAYAKSIARRS